MDWLFFFILLKASSLSWMTGPLYTTWPTKIYELNIISLSIFSSCHILKIHIVTDLVLKKNYWVLIVHCHRIPIESDWNTNTNNEIALQFPTLAENPLLERLIYLYQTNRKIVLDLLIMYKIDNDLFVIKINWNFSVQKKKQEEEEDDADFSYLYIIYLIIIPAFNL